MSEVAALYTAIAALASACVGMFSVGLVMLRREQSATDNAVLLLAASKAEDAKSLAACNADRVEDLKAAMATIITSREAILAASREQWATIVAEIRADRDADREMRHELADATQALALKYELAVAPHAKVPK